MSYDLVLCYFLIFCQNVQSSMIHTCANLSNLSNLLHFLPIILPILRSRTKYYHLYLYKFLKKVFVLFSILCLDDRRRDHPRYPLAITHFHYCFHCLLIPYRSPPCPIHFHIFMFTTRSHHFYVYFNAHHPFSSL